MFATTPESAGGFSRESVSRELGIRRPVATPEWLLDHNQLVMQRAIFLRCSTSWAECGRNELADGWCKYEPNESFWDIWSSAEFSVNSSLSRFFQSAGKYRVPSTGLFGHVGVGGAQPSQQFCSSSFGAADVAHALDGSNRVPQQQAFGSAFEALGTSSKSALTRGAWKQRRNSRCSSSSFADCSDR